MAGCLWISIIPIFNTQTQIIDELHYNGRVLIFIDSRHFTFVRQPYYMRTAVLEVHEHTL